MRGEGYFCHRAPSHEAKRAALTHRTAAFQCLPLLLGEHLSGRVVGNGRPQVLTAERQGSRAVTVSKETEVTDLNEAWRQDVEKKAADEFHCLQGHNLQTFAIFRVSPVKADAVVRQAQQPAIGDGDAMGIARQILEHVLGTAKGRLGIDDPIFLAELVQPSVKTSRVSERRQLSAELKLALRPGCPQKGEQLASEQAAEDGNREEEFPPARDPARPVQGQPARGNQTMHVGVKEQVLAPSMKHGEKTDAGSQESAIGRDLQQRLRHGAKQQSVEAAWILQS